MLIAHEPKVVVTVVVADQQNDVGQAILGVREAGHPQENGGNKNAHYHYFISLI
jgi:hypothetical protein